MKLQGRELSRSHQGDVAEADRAQYACKDLLLQDYRYCAESFWRNEQGGETRVNIFVGLLTLGLGTLITVGTTVDTVIVLTSLIALLVVGLATLSRMITRDEHTDEYKRGLDTIRQWFKDHLDPGGVLVQYYPVQIPDKPDTHDRRMIEPRRKFGGLAHTVAVVNSLILAAIVVAACDSFEVANAAAPANFSYILILASLAFLAAFSVQLGYVVFRERHTKQKVRSTSITHAGGIVYKQEDGLAKYLLVEATEDPYERVLPKGKIKPGEGHGEAALREVHEESGVFARLIGLVGRVDFQDVRAKFYLMEYLDEGEPRANRHPGWFTFKEALERVQYSESRFMLRAADRKRIAQSPPFARHEDRAASKQ
jgi:ADP-ribose pyrophosphatase YjhB (NUDIX family)